MCQLFACLISACYVVLRCTVLCCVIGELAHVTASEETVTCASLVLPLSVAWHATQCCAVLCYAMLCYAMLCYAMLWCAMLCCAMLCYATLCHSMLCLSILCYATLCLSILCYATLCFSMLCCAVLAYAMPCHTIPHPVLHAISPCHWLRARRG